MFSFSEKINKIFHLKKTLTVGVWHKFRKPPWGGGNQFTIALCKELSNKGVKILKNSLSSDIDVLLLNSIFFDVEKFRKFQEKKKLKILYRIDGPIQLYREKDKELDDHIFELNKEFASITILQSNWSLENILKLGYEPINPVVIHNAVDNEIFNNIGKKPIDKNRKIKIIASSWSANPRKGGAFYKWLEENLDANKYEFTFVGRCSEKLVKANVIEPIPSNKLSKLLKQHDIYITASKQDPCSNALIEALSCGLPALGLNDGGHPEIIKDGGLTFNGTEDLLEKLDILTENYDEYQAKIEVPHIKDVSVKYLELLKSIQE